MAIQVESIARDYQSDKPFSPTTLTKLRIVRATGKQSVLDLIALMHQAGMNRSDGVDIEGVQVKFPESGSLSDLERETPENPDEWVLAVLALTIEKD